MNRKVDEFIEALPDDIKELCEAIRELILENIPDVEEKLSFKIPFYYYFGMLMYINPNKEGLDVGFCRGKDLLEAFPQLTAGNRAIVATLSVCTKKDIYEKDLRQLIITAAAWNEEAKRLKIPMVKKKK